MSYYNRSLAKKGNTEKLRTRRKDGKLGAAVGFKTNHPFITGFTGFDLS